MKSLIDFPLISVIIATYNYAGFISKAIESVIIQTYPNVEIIVIDDGSTDDTKSRIKDQPQVKYFYQKNRGLSASRNVGVNKSSGKYLVFLDADDWLEKDALEKNYSQLHDKPEIAFVSGNYYLLQADTNTSEPITTVANSHHYSHLLRSNYIGMHAAVMFQRWVFNEFRYDESLQSCEDYDLYLNITRHYPVMHHPSFIATYYFHSAGLSHNYKTMMKTITAVIKKQAPYLKSPEEQMAYKEGLEQWKDYESLMQQQLSNA